ncbi:MAG: FAD-binding protein, partial [Sciscionella sp.]
MVWTNWGRNQRVAPRQVLRARDAGEIADTVKHAARDGLRIKVVGSGHSFTGIAVARDVQLSLAASASDVRIDAGRGTVTVPAGLS